MSPLLSGRPSRLIGVAVGLALIALAVYASITLGMVTISWQSLTDAYSRFDGSNQQLVIRDVRVPRALIAAAVGTSLGMSGALIQALTRNPLADVGILGINNGASLFVVAAVSLLSVSSLSQYVWFAFAGAAVSGIFVYWLGSIGRNGLTPVKITLAGAAIGALASSFTHTLLLLNERTMQEVLFWLAGSVEGRKLELLVQVLPYLAIGWVVALIVAGPLHTLTLGEDVATGLGQRTVLVKLVTGLVIVVLAGSSVSVAGPILFVGLVTPHIARHLVGSNTRWVVLYSAMLGAILLLAADLAARFVAMPKEVPIGVMTALIGTPFFLYTARKGNFRK
ncbi:siderophore ABC transporter permease [Paenibacillus sp. J31TS4]|uniref:FecCD family ABC transporter permease n=1 Tax=Paenibacillus sp. J31TS4 TaxID=2807195 RepID=UPI001B041D97|nr:iron ABC transporter permease [Paenibacillus sp. J31TS4]GIP37641.1 siderophore ABC transporter permease [Paenibacillus sp. J31TS4]